MGGKQRGACASPCCGSYIQSVSREFFDANKEAGKVLWLKAYLSLQYKRELLGTVICLSHMALRKALASIYKPIGRTAARTNDGSRHVRAGFPAGTSDKKLNSQHIPEVQETSRHIEFPVVLDDFLWLPRAQLGDGAIEARGASSM